MRPWRVQELIGSFEQSQPQSAYLLFIASPEDTKELEALNGVEHLVMPHRRGRGDWAKKINFGYRNTTAPWMLCGADDIHFRHGWDKALMRAVSGTGKRVLGTNDLNPHAHPQGIYSPHPLVARSYADELGTMDGPGAVVCEVYDHNYPDRELATTAIVRNEWSFVRNAVIEHLHPGWTGSRPDKTYRLGSRQIRRDSRIYETRMGRLVRRSYGSR